MPIHTNRNALSAIYARMAVAQGRKKFPWVSPIFVIARMVAHWVCSIAQ